MGEFIQVGSVWPAVHHALAVYLAAVTPLVSAFLFRIWLKKAVRKVERRYDRKAMLRKNYREV